MTQPPQDLAQSCDPEHGHGLREDALPAPAFQRGILQALADQAGVTVRSLGPFRIEVEHAGTRARFALDEAFKRYRHGETELELVTAEIRAAARLPGAEALAAGPFPRLARRSDLSPETYAEACPWDPELAVFYAMVLPSAHVPLTRDEVLGDNPWGGNAEALSALSSQNLAERTDDMEVAREGDGVRLVLGYAAGDGLDAARALLPDRMATLAAQVEGQARLLIPSRDVLMVVGDADPGFYAEARAYATEIHAGDDDGRLSPHGYMLASEGRLRLEDGPASA